MSHRTLMAIGIFVCIVLAGAWVGPYLKKVDATVAPPGPQLWRAKNIPERKKWTVDRAVQEVGAQRHWVGQSRSPTFVKSRTSLAAAPVLLRRYEKSGKISPIRSISGLSVALSESLLGGRKNEHAHAELSHYELEMRCRAPQLIIISWTTALEENVAGYKVHRHSLDGQQGHAWVNPVPITAHGPGDYRIIDPNVVPGRRYLYRLYVFDDTYQLSRAEQIVLANPAQPTCLYLPVVSNRIISYPRSSPPPESGRWRRC